MRSWWKAGWKRALVVPSAALTALVLAVALGYASPAQGATATSFSITVNGSPSSASINGGTSATLAETGLPSDATGTVTFTDASSDVLCTATLPATNCVTAATLATGTYVVSASYPGDTNYSASTSTNSISLTVLSTTTTVASASPSTAPFGTSITYSATVTSSTTTPTGTVTFRTPARELCSATLVGDTASCSATTAPIGTTTITARYLGDTASGPSHGMTTVTIVRATSSLTCSKVSGKATITIKVALCSPFSTLNRTARAPGSFLTSGGTLTWSRSLQTSVVSLSSTSPGQGACPRNFVEHDLTGDVTGGSSVYTLSGDPVSLRVCVSSRSHAVRLVAGTQADF